MAVLSREATDRPRMPAAPNTPAASAQTYTTARLGERRGGHCEGATGPKAGAATSPDAAHRCSLANPLAAALPRWYGNARSPGSVLSEITLVSRTRQEVVGSVHSREASRRARDFDSARSGAPARAGRCLLRRDRRWQPRQTGSGATPSPAALSSKRCRVREPARCRRWGTTENGQAEHATGPALTTGPSLPWLAASASDPGSPSGPAQAIAERA